MTRLRPYLLAAICYSCAADESVSPEPVRQAPIVFNGGSISTLPDIYTINFGGSGLRNLTNSPEEDTYPAWSRDYQKIAYFSEAGPEGIYIMNADGSDKRLVAAVDDVEHITWSPDGTRLAFQASIASVHGVHVVAAAGGVPQPLSTSPTGYSPSWSPDGKTIVYASGDGYGSEIYLIDATGKNRRNITYGWGATTGEVDPVWSPDGSLIAFARLSGPVTAMGVWVMNADGTNPRQITTGHDRVPAWSPDGTMLVMQRPNEQIQGVSLCIVYVATGRLAHCLTTGFSTSGNPSW